MALIELSPATPAPPAAAAPPPAYYYRRAGVALAVLLLLLVGGAAPARSVLWRRVGALPLPTVGDFQLIGGTLFTMDLAAEPWVLTAWQARPTRRLWSYRAAGKVDDPFYVQGSTPDYTVLRAGRSIIVLDAHTGAVAWRSPVAVQPVNDRVGFVEEEKFRPGTEYDAETGDPGQLYGMNTGALHTEPAQRTDLRGVDLGTGRVLWSKTFAGSVFTTWTGAPENAVVVLSADKLSLLSPVSGAVLRERAVPRLDGVGAEEGEVVGDTVLVHYGAYGMGGTVAAYALDTLAELWRRRQPDPAGNSASCFGLICARGTDRLTVLDPRTGLDRWQVTDTDVLAFGTDAVLEAQGMTTPVRTVDLRTGQTRTDLTWWSSFSAVVGDQAFLLSRADQSRSTVFGLLRAGVPDVQLLGRLPEPNMQQCQAVPGLVACRVPAGVELWSFTA